ncbi:MAG: hypothetical protein KKG75_01325 [Nanoarchaeota archaeon]|nr:hypothetical protein [Nanoarchaeota archaeon]
MAKVVKKGLNRDLIGKWAFIIGILLVFIVGLINMPYTAIILVVLGLVIGLLNVSKKEVSRLLIAGIGLVIVGTAGLELLPAVGTYVTGILKNLLALIGPAVLVASVKEIYEVTRT